MFPVALQVYSVRDDAAADMMGTLKKIADMGYDGVEFAGFYGYGAHEIREQLDALGLKAVSSHVPFVTLRNELEATADYHEILGCKYIAVPYLEPQDRPGTDGWQKTIDDILAIGKYLHSRGIQLLYHNHDFEFVRIDGKYALDMLYDAVPADYLQTELDTCWVKFAGEDPSAYIRKYAGRAPIVHLKDYHVEGQLKAGETPYALINADGSDSGDAKRSTFEFRPVGYGVQNFPEILAASADAGTQWVIVEQDQSPTRPPLEAARMSRDYLRSIGN